jgi:hypothetical protein
METHKNISFTEEEKLQKKADMTYTERFHLLMRLIRINRMLKNATIIHSDSK